uniref:Uncharacterized protein n=1 Tax=Eutreptiella gymnastica TaxID=73025 RepID=A0A6U8G194_9EUGL|mmetsp:Transcript_45803/g.81856  ORF Transcript_45803/g.81856 Transcript_45803/m.81856 type:complete len:108 (+) Transcript_45803:236-559(+)
MLRIFSQNFPRFGSHFQVFTLEDPATSPPKNLNNIASGPKIRNGSTTLKMGAKGGLTLTPTIPHGSGVNRGQLGVNGAVQPMWTHPNQWPTSPTDNQLLQLMANRPE